MNDEPLPSRLDRIRLLLLDVDGVLTDGRVVWHNDGIEQKAFHIRDGLGIRLWRRAGGKVGIITGRSSHKHEEDAERASNGMFHRSHAAAPQGECLDASSPAAGRMDA